MFRALSLRFFDADLDTVYERKTTLLLLKTHTVPYTEVH